MKLTQVKGNTWVAEGEALIPFYRLEDGRCILLDSGYTTERLQLEQALLDAGLTPAAILSTHTHIDHAANHAYFPVVFDGYSLNRDEIFEKLKENGIIARKYFYPLTNDYTCMSQLPTGGADKTPVAAHIAARVLTLPLFADLTAEDVDRICDIILG